MKISFCKIKIFFALIIMLWSCGQRGTPSGGIKDNIAPKIVESTPDSCGINFKGNKISWKFDEYVTTSGLKKELLISPPLKTQPTYKLTGKKLILTLDTLLNENTTYSIFLGKGVKDLNEGNPLENNILVFSTGEAIDSLFIKGEIYNAESMEDITEGMVHLYKEITDSIPAQKIPSYFAKIENGHFQFNNLAEGIYKLFYLKDNNNNFLYDLPDENIAFHTSEISVTNEIDSTEIILRAFSGELEKQFMTKNNCDFRGKFIFEFNLPVDTFKIKLGDRKLKKDWGILNWNKNKDSLVVWSSLLESQDSANFIIEYDGKIDTLMFDLTKKKKMSSQGIQIPQNFNPFGRYHKKSFEFSFSQPISSYDTSKILISAGAGDSSLASINYKNESLTDFKLNRFLEENSTYRLIFLPKAIHSIFDTYNNDTLNIDFATSINSSFGNLVINYNFKKASKKGILQVYFENKFKKEFFVEDIEGKLILEGIKPGNYQLKYIVDSNNDKKWTSGNYWKNRQPEMIYWYNQNITLRANWELDVNWELSLEDD